MAKTLLIVGFGPGVSTAMARKFGREGFSIGLIARTAAPLAEGVRELEAEGVRAAWVAADASDPGALREAIGRLRGELGPVTALHWNAYSAAAGDLLAADPESVRAVFDVAVVGLLAAVRAALPDLKAAGDGAVLVTNGAFGELDPAIDAYAVSAKAMGLAVANAAKQKLVGLLSAQLKDEGVYVGEVTIAGMVKGTAWSRNEGIDPAVIAQRFWELYRARDAVRARVA